MEVKIVSREEIIKLAKTPFEDGVALISVYDTDDVPPRLIYKPKYTLFMAFDDIYADEMDEVDLSFFKPFNEKMAKRMADFIKLHKDKVDTFICQCQFGQSRSAGIAAAIKKYFDNDEQAIFNDDRYSPNKKVYDLLLSVL